MSTLPAWTSDYDAVDAFADFDPAILASLRNSVDEADLVAADELQLAARATDATVLEFTAQRRRAHPCVEQRAA